MKKLLDTNTLLNGANSGVLVYPVLEELDRLKTREGAVGKNARDTIKYIYNNLERFEFLDFELKANQTVDDFLIEISEENNFNLITYDLSLYLKAISKGIDCDFGIEEEYVYSGITYLTKDEYNDFSKLDISLFPENHYLIYGNEVYCVQDGELEQVEWGRIKSFYTGEVLPRNPEQAAFIDTLNKEVPVVLITGGYGTGKSWLTLNHAISQLEQGKAHKIVVVPNNSFVADSREIAAVPGGLLEKEFMHLGPLIDLLGAEELESRYNTGEIELMPISIARGRNLDNCIIFVSESQNLTVDHVKLLLGRVGQNTRIIFDGDVKQADKKSFEKNNGLNLLKQLSRTEGQYLFSMVTLKSVERSTVAQLADVLDKLN